MGFDFNFGKQQVPLNEKVTNVQLSELGNEKLAKGQAQGMEFDVMSTMKRLGMPSSADEISKAMQPARPENKVKYILRVLHNKHWIEVLN